MDKVRLRPPPARAAPLSRARAPGLLSRAAALSPPDCELRRRRCRRRAGAQIALGSNATTGTAYEPQPGSAAAAPRCPNQPYALCISDKTVQRWQANLTAGGYSVYSDSQYGQPIFNPSQGSGRFTGGLFSFVPGLSGAGQVARLRVRAAPTRRRAERSALTRARRAARRCLSRPRSSAAPRHRSG